MFSSVKIRTNPNFVVKAAARATTRFYSPFDKSFFQTSVLSIHNFFYGKTFYKKMSLKNPKTLKKCYENLQPQTPELQFSKTLIFPRAL